MSAANDDAPQPGAPPLDGHGAQQNWRALDAVADHPAIRAMRAEALARLNAQPAVETPPALPRRSQPRRWLLRPMLGGALAASLVAVVGLGLAHRPAPRPAVPAAQDEGQVLANGQQLPRDVALADGTHITLDSHTQLHLAPGGRLARLDYGRAFFQVHHDAAHPFAVRVGGLTVQDIGTRFEVRQAGDLVTVTLVEGKARVTQGAAATDLVPGNRLTLSGGRQSVTTLDAGRQTLWQSGMISADDVPAGEIVAQYNRYLARPITLKDPAMGSLRISGEFRLDDPQGFLDAVAAMGGAAHP
jgi:transmembrane sensor